MKYKTTLLATAFALGMMSTSAMAENSVVESSVAMASAVGSVTFGSALVLSSPILIVSSLVEESEKNKMQVKVKDKEGKEATLSLPKEACEKANLKAGDNLTSKPTKTGVLLVKEKTPVIFIVTPQNAGLSKNEELRR